MGLAALSDGGSLTWKDIALRFLFRGATKVWLG